MKPTLSLRWKILAWFFVNLAVIAVGLALFLPSQFRLGLDSLLAGPTGQRLEAIARPLAAELPKLPESEWGAALDRTVAVWRERGVKALIVRNNGQYVVGDKMELPAGVREVVERYDQGRRGWMGGPGMGPMPGFGKEHHGPMENHGFGAGDPFFGFFDGMPPPMPFIEHHRMSMPETQVPGFVNSPMTKFMLLAGSPRLYWAGVHLDSAPGSTPLPVTLLFVSPSLQGGGLFFNFAPWLWLGAGLFFISVLLWMPFVHQLIRALARLTHHAEQIAQGSFEPPPVIKRRDELGRLNAAHRNLAARLDGYVSGQRRFLGDTAHELLSPLARLEVAISILDQRSTSNDRAYLERALGEVHHISALVHDLLSFTKVGMRREVKLQSLPLKPLVQEVVACEAENQMVQIEDIPDTLLVNADAALLRRALANVVRNAVRYAGTAGPITIRAQRLQKQVLITVSDEGSGVPEESLSRLFDPFYRPDTTRSRDTGGTGLGLAIVKNGIEACGGAVIARNRQPHGLEIEMQVHAAEA